MNSIDYIILLLPFAILEIRDCSVGGEMININSMTLILAGSKMIVSWIVPMIVSGIGLAIVVLKKY